MKYVAVLESGLFFTPIRSFQSQESIFLAAKVYYGLENCEQKAQVYQTQAVHLGLLL